jgi:ActR/RegA family two-component response regulator
MYVVGNSFTFGGKQRLTTFLKDRDGNVRTFENEEEAFKALNEEKAKYTITDLRVYWLADSGTYYDPDPC